MSHLILSICILWIVPLVWHALHRTPLLIRVEKIAILVILAIIMFGFMPHHLAEDGWLSLVYLLGSALSFTVVERFAKTVSMNKSHPIAFFGVFLALHALADGIGIGIAEAHTGSHHHHHGEEMLATTIALHRLPAGIGIWSFLYPLKGWKHPTVLFAIMTFATVLGYAMAQQDLTGFHGPHETHILEYLIAGGLIHFGFHAVSHPRQLPVTT
ncbi:hypothetical protein [Pseudobacteriovorax antillogorgiicola]|uniref:ZIP Zinc transporter n=1 Tax=Pseudobacteriovorax antillogorgiicola TaxID=1513793 RepID=A0A1Y6CHR6_9BACT|nr:hypothetical protein [Pseudobacteriovorax antillogorgiicola]TCS46994.1 hypothetical protein EDD56_12289 [Pseudobacteriovorax antillogorgiicola]SMF64903.1 hypothetical protein SAMN06296036_12289 [Pseudobacteriovorax antillogorgiicola]